MRTKRPLSSARGLTWRLSMLGARRDIKHPKPLAKRDRHHRRLRRGVRFVAVPNQLALPNAMLRDAMLRVSMEK